jgi:hypothetical protein
VSLVKGSHDGTPVWEVQLDGITHCWDGDLEGAAALALTYRALLKATKEVELGPGVPPDALELGYRLSSVLEFYVNKKPVA